MKEAHSGSAHKHVLRSEKSFYLDVLRLIALFLSIFAYMGGREAGPLVSTITTMGPMLFFMVSGAALLNDEEELSTVWLKRILPVFAGLFIFSFLYFLCDVKLDRDQFDLTVFGGDFYGQDRIFAFWYIYAYLGFLVSLPFLRTLARNLRESEFVYLLIIAFVIQTALPVLDDMYFMRRYVLNPSLKITWMVNTVIIFPLAGYYIHYCLTREQMKRIVAAFWGIAILWLFIVVKRTNYYTMFVASGSQYHEYERQCYLPLGMAVFTTARLVINDRPIQKVLHEIAHCSYGVYLMQGFFYMHIEPIERMRTALIGEKIGRAMIPPLLVWTVITCLVLMLLTVLLRRIPVVRRIFDYE